MKLTCSKQALSAAFQVVSSVVPTRTPREILRNIKLSVTNGQASLLGTDQEVGVRCELGEVQTSSVGEALLPTKRTAEILREVQGDTITIEVEDGAIWIRAGQSEFRLSVEDAAEFPEIAPFAEENYYVVQGKSLKQGIQRTVFATDVESTRYALGGVLLEMRSGQLTLAATDSRRLAVYKTGCGTRGNVAEEVGQPVIPSKAMSLIERTIHDDDQEVCIAIRQNNVLVKSGSTTIFARLVEGRFPRYQDVMPSQFNIRIDLVAGPFLSAVRQAMIVTNEESRGVDFTFAEGLLTLVSVGQDVGTSKIQLPVGYEGEEIVITFDPKYVADFLRVLDGATAVGLHLVDPDSAAVFKADENYVYVVMPLARDDR